MNWTDYDEQSWEFQAGKALATMKCDGPYKLIKNSYRELYDADSFDAIARKAMRELNELDPGTWLVDYQVGLLASKQHDYGHENINRFGSGGVRVRLWDKISRYENLVKRGEAENESIEDTLVDMVGYATIYVMVKNGTFSYPLQAELERA
jgi:hypothetical protein